MAAEGTVRGHSSIGVRVAALCRMAFCIAYPPDAVVNEIKGKGGQAGVGDLVDRSQASHEWRSTSALTSTASARRPWRAGRGHCHETVGSIRKAEV
jgi:hypothetical protein